jgi:hypothetical protein
LWGRRNVKTGSVIGIAIGMLKARAKSADCLNNTPDTSPGVIRQRQFLVKAASYLTPVYVEVKLFTTNLGKFRIINRLTGRGQRLNYRVLGQGRSNSHTPLQAFLAPQGLAGIAGIVVTPPEEAKASSL